MKPLQHSLEGLIKRLGIDPLRVNRFMEEWLKTAKPCTLEEANEVANITRPKRRDKYYLAPDPLKPDEKVLLITRDEKIITLLTALTAQIYGDGGTRKIKTMDGKEVQGDGRWVTGHNRQRNKGYRRFKVKKKK